MTETVPQSEKNTIIFSKLEILIELRIPGLISIYHVVERSMAWSWIRATVMSCNASMSDAKAAAGSGTDEVVSALTEAVAAAAAAEVVLAVGTILEWGNDEPDTTDRAAYEATGVGVIVDDGSISVGEISAVVTCDAGSVKGAVSAGDESTSMGRPPMLAKNEAAKEGARGIPAELATGELLLGSNAMGKEVVRVKDSVADGGGSTKLSVGERSGTGDGGTRNVAGVKGRVGGGDDDCINSGDGGAAHVFDNPVKAWGEICNVPRVSGLRRPGLAGDKDWAAVRLRDRDDARVERGTPACLTLGKATKIKLHTNTNGLIAKTVPRERCPMRPCIGDARRLAARVVSPSDSSASESVSGTKTAAAGTDARNPPWSARGLVPTDAGSKRSARARGL